MSLLNINNSKCSQYLLSICSLAGSVLGALYTSSHSSRQPWEEGTNLPISQRRKLRLGKAKCLGGMSENGRGGLEPDLSPEPEVFLTIVPNPLPLAAQARGSQSTLWPRFPTKIPL